MGRFARVCVTGGLVVVLAACGGGAGQPDAESTGSVVTGGAPSPTSPTSPVDPASPTSPSSPQTTAQGADETYLPSPEPELTLPATRLGKLERVSGVVGTGVERGCRMLSPDNGGPALVLLVEDHRVAPGSHITVEGYRAESTMTTCQQGVPFTVLRVSDLGLPTQRPTN